MLGFIAAKCPEFCGKRLFGHRAGGEEGTVHKDAGRGEDLMFEQEILTFGRERVHFAERHAGKLASRFFPVFLESGAVHAPGHGNRDELNCHRNGVVAGFSIIT